MNLQEEFNKLDSQKALLIGIGLAAFYYFFVFNDGSKILRRTQQHRNTLAERQVTLQKVRRALEDKDKYEQDIQEIESNMKDFQRYFVNDTDQNALVAHVSAFAEESEISVERMKPVEKNREFPKYREIAVELEVEGNFHNIMEFISRLTTMNRAIDFSKMEFKAVKEGDFPVVRLSTTLVVYSSDESDGGNA